tara:strand:- start:1316 stop:1642 length:327 start_codon:yes stop_codon:yes gene_type:complete
MTGPVFLCRLDEIEDPGSRGFENIDGEKPFFVVRRGGDVFAYRNSCPHYGAPLDWKPDAFLSYDKDLILCSMHSALFNIDDGICIDGPCPGQRLEKVKLTVKDNKIFV